LLDSDQSGCKSYLELNFETFGNSEHTTLRTRPERPTMRPLVYLVEKIGLLRHILFLGYDLALCSVSRIRVSTNEGVGSMKCIVDGRISFLRVFYLFI